MSELESKPLKAVTITRFFEILEHHCSYLEGFSDALDNQMARSTLRSAANGLRKLKEMLVLPIKEDGK
jgi:hypothetical protein